MEHLTCLDPTCDSAKIVARGLCNRCYTRHRKAGTLDSFKAPARICGTCGNSFTTGKNGKHGYCSSECQLEGVRLRRLAKRESELTRPCEVCGETITHDRRSDARYCSVPCQQSVWNRANAALIAERVSLWKMNNRDRAKDSDHKRRAAMRGSAVGPIDYQQVFERDNGNCWICGEAVDPSLTYPHPKYRSWDHVIPIIKGGSHTMDNVALSHLVCNTSKKSKILDRVPAWAS